MADVINHITALYIFQPMENCELSVVIGNKFPEIKFILTFRGFTLLKSMILLLEKYSVNMLYKNKLIFLVF